MEDNDVFDQSSGKTPPNGAESESQAVHIVLICSAKLLFIVRGSYGREKNIGINQGIIRAII